VFTGLTAGSGNFPDEAAIDRLRAAGDGKDQGRMSPEPIIIRTYKIRTANNKPLSAITHFRHAKPLTILCGTQIKNTSL
jgi:hypothetical protein